MQQRYRKIILVLLDGLRPDAITDGGMPNLSGLMRGGWRAGRAVTVRPSITVAALTSLASGVHPDIHGLVEPRLPNLPRLRTLRPLPMELRRLGVETTVVVPGLGAGARWLAGALLRLGGIGRLRAVAAPPARVLHSAIGQMEGNPAREFVIVYLNDADLAGHAWGWMSPGYLHAAGVIDRALAGLVPLTTREGHLVIVTADHGGGGVTSRDHDAAHPTNDRIPLALIGDGIGAGQVGRRPVHLLDLPPTVPHGFGGMPPAGCQGRIIHEAFTEELVPA